MVQITEWGQKILRISQELNEKNPSKKSHKAPQKITNKNQ
ncbi:Uncharacterised protein [Helicobacter mustelae]|nr:Uncharacterised protein [Helicobacter mustelae]